jgi:hypothetical protein
MYASTCCGFLGLAVTFGLAVLGLTTDYAWLGAMAETEPMSGTMPA